MKIKKSFFKWFFIGLLFISFSSCLNEEDEEVEPLLSTIDGEEYYAIVEGDMNIEKAFILIDQDSVLAIPNELFIQMMKNLLDKDSSYRVKNFEYLTKINYDITHQFPKEVHVVLQSFWFAKLLEFPSETIRQLQQLGGPEYDFWLFHLRSGYKSQLKEEGVTKVSVINLMIKNCKNCSVVEQEDFVSFVEFLELE